MRSLGIVLMGTMMVLGTGAMAEEAAAAPAGGEKPGGRGAHVYRAAMLKEFDRDGDGKLSDQEKADMNAAREARLKEMLAKYDKDRDGRVSDVERIAMRADMKAKWEAEMLKKYDKDGDGKLSDEEKAAMPKRGEHGRRGDKGKGPDAAPKTE